MSALIDAFDSVLTQAGTVVVLVVVLDTRVGVEVTTLVVADCTAVTVAAKVALTVQKPSETEDADAGATGTPGWAAAATTGLKETSNGDESKVDEPNGSLASSV
jgi:hypothetical protein